MTRSLMTGVAFAAMLGFSGAVSAQTMINGMEVSADELPRVQAQCQALTEQQQTESLVSDTEDFEEEEGQDTADDASTDNDSADGTNQALTTIDLDTLTLEQCQEAGLTETMM